MLILDLNDRCNNQCVFCFEAGRIGRRARPLTESRIVAMLSRAKKRGVSVVDFFGGEPTLYEFLPDVIAYAVKLGFKVSLATNARKFADEDYTKTYRKFPGLVIRSSLHADIPRLHDAITMKEGSFNETVAGFRNILNLGNQQLLVNVVITRMNVSRLLAIAKFLHAMGVKQVKFSGLISDGICLRYPELIASLQQIKISLKKAVSFCSKNNISLRFEKMPICLLPSCADFFIKEKQCSFEHHEICEQCDLRTRCPGVDRIAFLLHPKDKALLRPIHV